MPNANLNRLIDSLTVRYIMANKRQVIKPVVLSGTVEPKDVLIYVNSGYFGGGKNNDPISEGELYLVPKGNEVHFFHGKGPYHSLGSEGFVSFEQREEFLKPLEPLESGDTGASVFTIIGFDAMIHESIPLLAMLDIPNIKVGKNPIITDLIQKILLEEIADNIGKRAMIRKLTEQIIIHIYRYLYNIPELKTNFNKVSYLLDKRLIDIFQYINDHLGEDLSNNKIADLAFVSKDYIGQFFKTLTGNNLQDYIENRRLERAHYLLRNSKTSIQEIALKVGFKDPAYFSRRFKIRYNLNAKDVRKTEYQVL